jgi:hypothetical protein
MEKAMAVGTMVVVMEEEMVTMEKAMAVGTSNGGGNRGGNGNGGGGPVERTTDDFALGRELKRNTHSVIHIPAWIA